MYAIWLPHQNGSTWQRADSGATIGGTFRVRVVVRPNNGYLYGGAYIVENSVTELADHHYGQTHMGNFAAVSPDPNYGDPSSNVAVLQSEYLFLPHNATYRLRVRARYVVIPPFPPQNLVEEEGEMLIALRNLQIVDSRSEPYFVWKPSTHLEPPVPPPVGLDNLTPEDPPASGVPFSAQLLDAQQGTCTVRLEIFGTADNRTPVLVREFANVPRPGTWSWVWDGRLDNDTVAPRGIYTYRLSVHAGWVPWADGDSTISSYLHLERVYNENNEPLLEAEYWGYDDGGTPDTDTDDQHLYFVRWYVLRDRRNASSGEIWLFDPELQRIGSWDLSQLPCVEHNNQPDGLTASTAGVKHGVIVRVPVSLMVTPGEYLFLVHAVDNHPDEEKCHRRKPALPLNAQVRMPSVDIYAPDDALEFRRGCRIDVRIMVKYYRSGDVVQPWVGDSLKANLTVPFYLSGSIAKFNYLWDTSQTQRGAHTIRAQLLRDGRAIGFADTQRVRIFAMRWPEPGIIWGGFDPTHHRGVDIFWSDPCYIPAGVPTKQPIARAHDGEVWYNEHQDGMSGGGWRAWVRYGQKVRTDLLDEAPSDGIPRYKERFVFSFYSHLLRAPWDDPQWREDNSGNARLTSSHLHFSVFLNTKNSIPDYETGEADDPVRWLELPKFYTISGTIVDEQGNLLGGVRVHVRGNGVDGYAATYERVLDQNRRYPGRYRVYVPPGTYIVSPRLTDANGRDILVFAPQTVVVTDRSCEGVDFVGRLPSPP